MFDASVLFRSAKSRPLFVKNRDIYLLAALCCVAVAGSIVSSLPENLAIREPRRYAPFEIPALTLTPAVVRVHDPEQYRHRLSRVPVPILSAWQVIASLLTIHLA